MSGAAAQLTAHESDDSEAMEVTETFEDIGDEAYIDKESGGDVDPFDFDSEEDETPLYKKQQEKAAAKSKAKGDIGEQHKVLETIVDDEEESEDEDDATEEVSAEKEKKQEEAKPTEEKDSKAPKGKKLSVKIGEETFAIDSNATIPHKVDGKVENIPVQELLNNYSGKVAWDKRMNEVNVKNQEFQRKEQAVVEREEKINTQMKEVMDLINDPEKNPFDALYKIVDLQNGNRYDFWERAFKTQLEELSTVLAMQGPERSNFFLKKKNEYLDERVKKRDEAEASSLKLNRYKEQAAQLRKSYEVTETQYVDSYEEIKSWGYKPEEISEQQIVEWAAIKPHSKAVEPVLENYRDRMSPESFSELKFKLATYLRTGQENLQSITATLEEVFGVPSDVKELNEELKPLGRPKNSVKESKQTKPKLESFSDLEEDDEFND